MAFCRRMIEVQLVYSSARRLVTAMLLVPVSLGVLLLACAVATGRVGYVTTNGVSMNPVYYQGDLVVVARADSYKIGQIVAYRLPAKHLVVLHRIIGGDASGYVFKGDNNQSTDPTRPAGDQLIGRAVLHIAHGGIWFDRVTSPTALGILAFLLTSVRPSRPHTILARCAHGQARDHTRRYRPDSTGQRPSASGPSPGAESLSRVIRSVNRLTWRTNSPAGVSWARRCV